MDTKGNIQYFEDEADALLQGFETRLTQQQADALQRLSPSERHTELTKMRHAEYLEKLKAAEYDGLQGRAARRAAKKSGVKRAHKYR